MTAPSQPIHAPLPPWIDDYIFLTGPPDPVQEAYFLKIFPDLYTQDTVASAAFTFPGQDDSDRADEAGSAIQETKVTTEDGADSHFPTSGRSDTAGGDLRGFEGLADIGEIQGIITASDVQELEETKCELLTAGEVKSPFPADEMRERSNEAAFGNNLVAIDACQDTPEAILHSADELSVDDQACESDQPARAFDKSDRLDEQASQHALSQDGDAEVQLSNQSDPPLKDDGNVNDVWEEASATPGETSTGTSRPVEPTKQARAGPAPKMRKSLDALIEAMRVKAIRKLESEAAVKHTQEEAVVHDDGNTSTPETHAGMEDAEPLLTGDQSAMSLGMAENIYSGGRTLAAALFGRGSEVDHLEEVNLHKDSSRCESALQDTVEDSDSSTSNHSPMALSSDVMVDAPNREVCEKVAATDVCDPSVVLEEVAVNNVSAYHVAEEVSGRPSATGIPNNSGEADLPERSTVPLHMTSSDQPPTETITSRVGGESITSPPLNEVPAVEASENTEAVDTPSDDDDVPISKNTISDALDTSTIAQATEGTLHQGGEAHVQNDPSSDHTIPNEFDISADADALKACLADSDSLNDSLSMAEDDSISTGAVGMSPNAKLLAYLDDINSSVNKRHTTDAALDDFNLSGNGDLFNTSLDEDDDSFDLLAPREKIFKIKYVGEKSEELESGPDADERAASETNRVDEGVASDKENATPGIAYGNDASSVAIDGAQFIGKGKGKGKAVESGLTESSIAQPSVASFGIEQAADTDNVPPAAEDATASEHVATSSELDCAESSSQSSAQQNPAPSAPKDSKTSKLPETPGVAASRLPGSQTRLKRRAQEREKVEAALRALQEKKELLMSRMEHKTLSSTPSSGEASGSSNPPNTRLASASAPFTDPSLPTPHESTSATSLEESIPPTPATILEMTDEDLEKLVKQNHDANSIRKCTIRPLDGFRILPAVSPTMKMFMRMQARQHGILVQTFRGGEITDSSDDESDEDTDVQGKASTRRLKWNEQLISVHEYSPNQGRRQMMGPHDPGWDLFTTESSSDVSSVSSNDSGGSRSSCSPNAKSGSAPSHLPLKSAMRQTPFPYPRVSSPELHKVEVRVLRLPPSADNSDDENNTNDIDSDEKEVPFMLPPPPSNTGASRGGGRGRGARGGNAGNGRGRGGGRGGGRGRGLARGSIGGRPGRVPSGG
ncbi:hypothetical protein DFJ77DRAFT_475145 [Powellomyces hirtus]|nr:hypothetical protein DFJ77DRAFT_475145 [Powellomyces hirtus]